MTASHRSRRVIERDTDVPIVDEIPHIDRSSRSMVGSIPSLGEDSRIPYEEHDEEQDPVASDFDDVPVPAPRARKSRYEFDTFSGPIKDELKQLMAPYGQDELELLEASGLDSLEHFYMKNVDKGLMHAFIERWQPKTNNFHMPWGEMTITLHDVAFILGLRVEV
ncbi:PREDICTED: uncharacterized protein LOC105958573 [Erythranthe guttata]|uniref:uncharacterized protein LOC105958573 n=1 Tax=Erythranthe guttata TaxID=4155 RepID=UPI00064D8665|nr:PREDICTED: uncharacterized protein LOC105958573 [Erythranthe guttata]|eukprot:XP_012838029.1 PREDICTED: uncharacterized protein LOC105958573 [Erythranthe guttata]